MTKALQRQLKITGANAPQFRPSGSSANLFNQLSAGLEQTSREMQAKSDSIYINTFSTEAREASREIYNNNINNPDELLKQLNAYKSESLKAAPFNLKSKLENQFSSIANTYINQASTLKNQQLTSQAKLAIDNEKNSIIKNNDFVIEQLFNNENLSPEQIQSKNITLIENLAQNMKDFDSIMYQLDDKGEVLYDAKTQQPLLRTEGGKILFTSNQAINLIEEVEQQMFTKIGKSYVMSSDNNVEAMEDWLNNDVFLDTPLGSVNPRMAMNADIRSKVDKELMSMIKNDISLDRRKEELEEKQFDELQDEVEKGLYDLAKTNTLTPNTVESYRNILSPRDYNKFLKISIEKDPITDQLEYAKLVNRVTKGENIKAEIDNARFNSKTLSTADYEHLTNLVKKDTNTRKNIPDPINEKRDFALGVLGSNADLISIGSSATLAAAESYYNDGIIAFENLNNRQPNRKEADEIARDTIASYANSTVDEFILPKPKYLPLDNKYSLKESDLEKARNDTTKFYLNKYNNNIERTKNDPEYIRELNKIDNYKALVEFNDLIKKETK
jgi:hypothetical protein